MGCALKSIPSSHNAASPIPSRVGERDPNAPGKPPPPPPEPTGSAPVADRLPFPSFPPRSPPVSCCKDKTAHCDNMSFPFGPLHAMGSASEQTQNQPVESLRDKFSSVPLQGTPRRVS